MRARSRPARPFTPHARIAYVDSDPSVVSHLQAPLAKGNPGVSVLSGDAREVAAVLNSIGAGLDLPAPACLIVGYLLHFFTADAARDMVTKYAAALAPGGCLVLSVLHSGCDAADEGLNTYSSKAAPVHSHPEAEIASFFGPLELVPPGLVDARRILSLNTPSCVRPQ